MLFQQHDMQSYSFYCQFLLVIVFFRCMYGVLAFEDFGLIPLKLLIWETKQ